MADINALIAAHRFGMGARFGELDAIAPNPRIWLATQLTGLSSMLDGYNLISSADAIKLFFDYQAAKRAEETGSASASFGTSSGTASKQSDRERFTAFFAATAELKRTEQMVTSPTGNSDVMAALSGKTGDKSAPPSAVGQSSQQLLEQLYNTFIQDMAVRSLHATVTPGSFRERLVRFWSDHFSVDFNKSLITVPTAITLEREAIRPHVTGKFYDMLVAVESHPSMLIYLDNWASFGTNSWAGKQFGLGLNENLARETLELHTLGVGGGYSQADIIEYAKAITGWTVGNPAFNEESLGRFVFQRRFHEPGTRTVMGKSYRADGQNQALAALQDFVRHPSTAKHIARKLAFHFHSDTPPQTLVDRLSKVFADSDGDLLQVSMALVSAPEMWDGAMLKLRNTEEFLIAAYRAFDIKDLQPEQVVDIFDMMGQLPFTAGSPAGWPDDEASWASSSIIAERLDLSVLIGGIIDGAPLPPDYAENLFGTSLSNNSRQLISGAFTKAQGYALMLMMPEFQRR